VNHDAVSGFEEIEGATIVAF